MCIRMLPRPIPSTTNSNSNSSISFSLPISPSTANQSSAPPSGPATTPQLSSADVKLPVSWSSTSPVPTPGTSAGSTVSSTQPGQVHLSTQVSTSSPQDEGPGGGGGTANLPSSGASGVVVVGVIGRESHELSYFVDRLLDPNPIGVKGRFRERAHDRHEEFSVSSPDLVREIVRDRKQKKDGHRSRGSSATNLEEVVFSKEEKNDTAQKSGRIGKSHAKNAAYHDRRKEEDEGDAAVDDHQKSNVQYASRNGKVGGGDEDSVKAANDGWKDNSWNFPWLLNKLKYHHDGERGIVYLQFHWGMLSKEYLKDSGKGTTAAADMHTRVENSEADDMRGLLFMFSVCHVILLVQEGTSFDPRLLRVFRLLQTAKHCLAPFIKTQILPGLLPAPSSSSGRPSPLKHGSSPGVVGHGFGRAGALGRTASTVALMSGSTPALIPGQCIPVVVFIYLEDMAEQPASSVSPYLGRKRAGDLPDMSSSIFSQVGWSQPITGSPCENFQVRVPGSEGETLRSSNNKKTDLGMRKKMQASLEQQIISLLKKCRTVAGLGDSSSPLGSGLGGSGMGSRAGCSNVNFQGVGGGGALFVLDPSRAVILVDRCGHWQTDALDAARDSIEGMMMSGVDDWKDYSSRDYRGTDAVVTSGGDDIQAVKDFLLRQTEMLRGKGGISGSNTSASAAGVGMVAAAAAAAAASAASGLAGAGSNKPICNPPELPTFSSWSSACKVLGVALSLRMPENLRDQGVHSSRSSDAATQILSKKGVLSPTRISANIGNVGKTKVSIESSLACLETSAHMDMKFSAAWCKRVLPFALGSYLKGLPPCYPTSLHKSQLDKTLRLFRSMVRGYAVPFYAEKLQMKCEAIWHSGRQLCDAESLTGKPCIHQVHDISITSAHSHVSNGVKHAGNGATSRGGQSEKQLVLRPHSSGVVFLHACACGRSRKLRKDPFDFESANVSFFRFSNCEDLLPSLGVSNSPGGGSGLESSSWSLVRLGSARYYQPAMGLHQSGFVPNHNFLSRLSLPVLTEETQGADSSTRFPLKEDPLPVPPSHGAVASIDPNKPLQPIMYGSETRASPNFNLFGRNMRNGDSDGISAVSSWDNSVVVDTTSRLTDGATLTSVADEQLARFALYLGKSAKHPHSRERKHLEADEANQNQNTISRLLVSSGSPYDFGLSDDELDSSAKKQVRMFIGFEYECPHGHRFLLSIDESGVSLSETVSFPGDSSKHKRIDQLVSQAEDVKPAMTKTRQSSPPATGASKNPTDAASHRDLPAQNQKFGMRTLDQKHKAGNVRHFHGPGHSLLNSDLPIYMHCPYCKGSEEDKYSKKRAVFGGTISQLQRVFLVTPPLPHRLASCPVVKFEDTSKPHKRTVEYNPGGELVLPPDSFLSLRLPFVYYSESEGAPHTPLLVNQEKPEHCACLVKNTVLYCL